MATYSERQRRKIMKVGETAQPWAKYDCECGVEYHVARTETRVITERDFHCHDCNNEIDKEYELDLLRKEVRSLKMQLGGMVEVAEELNYRLSQTDRSEGFKGNIELAKTNCTGFFESFN